MKEVDEANPSQIERRSVFSLESWPSAITVPVGFFMVFGMIVLAGGATLIGMYFAPATASAMALVGTDWRNKWVPYAVAPIAWLLLALAQLWAMHLAGCTARTDANYYQEQEPFIY